MSVDTSHLAGTIRAVRSFLVDLDLDVDLVVDLDGDGDLDLAARTLTLEASRSGRTEGRGHRRVHSPSFGGLRATSPSPSRSTTMSTSMSTRTKDSRETCDESRDVAVNVHVTSTSTMNYSTRS